MRQIKFEANALAVLEEWIKVQLKTTSKILDMIQEIVKKPFEGKSKPEPLKLQLKGYWSRRINEEHRLIYDVTDTMINIISCKGHY